MVCLVCRSSMVEGFDRGTRSRPYSVIAIDPLQKLLDLATEKGLITELRGRVVTMRTSMYADNTAIFIKTTKEMWQPLLSF